MMYVHTRYFFAGGSARSPCVKVLAYSAFFSRMFFWISDSAMMAMMVVVENCAFFIIE